MTDVKEETSRSPEEVYWENIDANDCGYLLRNLEREAYSSVVNALRAKGPPSEHTFLLLDHLKSALSINDELGRADIRKAAFDSKLSKIASVLNPSYDTVTEWSLCSVESRGGVEAKPIRAKPFAKTTTLSIADQLLQEATERNEKMNQSTGRSFELLSLPPQPFVPERLRMLLRETDRPCERVPPPLEPIPLPPPPPHLVEKTTKRKEEEVIAEEEEEEDLAPPAKKRRPRKVKETKETKETTTPPALTAHKSPKLPGEDIVMDPSFAPAVTQLLAAVQAIESVAGTSAASPNQPPQVGDAMKQWEKELAASTRKNGVGKGRMSPVDANPVFTAIPSRVLTPEEEANKRKRKPRAPPVDPILLNTCARTRPYEWDKERQASLKDKNPPPPQKTVPVKSLQTSNVTNLSSTKRHSQTVFNISPTTPLTRPAAPDLNYLSYGGRNGSMDDQTAALVAMASMASAQTAAAFGGINPSTPIVVPPKKTLTPNSSQFPSNKYFIPHKAGASYTSAFKDAKTPSTSSGLAGRTGSLGSQQLNYIHSSAQKPSTSTSSGSLMQLASGGTINIGGTSSSIPAADPAQPVTALPPEVGGHDYSFKVMSRVPQPSILRSPTVGVSPSPQVPSTSNGMSPFHLLPRQGNTSTPSLQRAGSMSSIRPRSGSRGTTSTVVTGSGGERTEKGPANMTDPVTDGMVQATVNNIFLETAQKECANGKRSTVPPRENGIFNHQHPIPSTSFSSRPSTSSDGGSSGVTTTSAAPRSILKKSSITAPTPLKPVSSVLSSTPVTDSPSTPLTAFPQSLLPSLTPSSPSTYTNALLVPQGHCENVRQYLDRANKEQVRAAAMSTAVSSVPPPPTPPSIPTPSTDMDSLLMLSNGQSQSLLPPLNPPRPVQRQYVLQPEGMGYSEFSLDNPSSFKSFDTNGALLHFGVSAEELQDGAGRASTSGGRGVGGTRPTQQPPSVYSRPSVSASIPSSFLNTPITPTGVHVNGEMSSTAREPQSLLQLSRASGGADVPLVEHPPSQPKDILEQSCMELR